MARNEKERQTETERNRDREVLASVLCIEHKKIGKRRSKGDFRTFLGQNNP